MLSAGIAAGALLLLAGTGSAQTCVNTLEPGTHTITIAVEEKGFFGNVKLANRQFNVFVPSGLQPNDPRPALFTYHGYAGNPSGIADITNVPAHAEAQQWFGVFPRGTGLILSWNGAGCCVGNTKDDVSFARGIVSWLGANLCLDTTRVFATGFSNGGFMTNRLACEASDIFAAFAPHSALMGTQYVTECNPQFTRPFLSFHGLNDGVVPFHGNGNWISFSQMMDYWTSTNECGGEENAVEIFRTATTHCIRYDSCKDDVPVEYCDIVDMAHVWSGSSSGSASDIDATAYIFSYFNEVGSWMEKRAQKAKTSVQELFFKIPANRTQTQL